MMAEQTCYIQKQNIQLLKDDSQRGLLPSCYLYVAICQMQDTMLDEPFTLIHQGSSVLQ